MADKSLEELRAENDCLLLEISNKNKQILGLISDINHKLKGILV